MEQTLDQIAGGMEVIVKAIPATIAGLIVFLGINRLFNKMDKYISRKERIKDGYEMDFPKQNIENLYVR